jgi:hypothetical protein
MPRIKILLFSAVAIAIVALFAASEVLAQPQQCGADENTADYECNDGMKDNYTVRIAKPHFPLIAPCANSPGNCSTWSWNISPPSLSHFNLVVDRSFGAEIVDSSGDPLSTLLDCDESGDGSQGGSDFGRLLMGHCLLRLGSNSLSLTLRGEFAAAPTTSWYVKQASCDYGDDCEFEGDFGITQGLAPECVDLSLKVTPSASEECKILGYYFDETNNVWIPVSMLLKREVDGCTVLSTNVYFFKNEPECQGDKTCTPGTEGCNLLQKAEATPDPDRNYCMALDGPPCNDCVENESGSPQEWWYWNNNQLNYSCFDLANPPSYLCPAACYENAKCPEE